MIGGKSRDMILKAAFCLLIFSVREVKSQEPCSNTLKNIAVREGTVNTFIDFPTNPNSAVWGVYPTTDASYRRAIVYYDDTVNPDYEADYAFETASGLTIKKATITAEPGHETSTAGLYEVTCDQSGDYYFSFLVVRQGPTCSCTRVNSESVQLTCSSIYADTEFYSMNAIFTIYADDTSIATDTPSRTSYDSQTYISTSAFTINYAASSTYQCNQTFSKPLNANLQFAANAPEFNQQCSFVCPPATTTEATTTEATTTEATTPEATTTEATTTEATPEATTPEATTTEATTTTTPGGTPPVEDCKKTRQCQPEHGTDNTGIYFKSVVKAQLYTRSDKCCPGNQVCGVVVTLQNGSRYLIHDAVCNDNKFKMAVVAASCMASDWNLVSQKIVILSNVEAFVAAGNIAQIGSIIIPFIKPCNAMMILP